MESFYRILRKFILLGSFLIAVLSIQAQTPDNIALNGERKGKFVIKPNSREEKVVMRDNTLNRIDKQRNQAVIQRMQQMRQKRLMMKKNDNVRRQEILQRRKLMMQKRRSLRK
jgi:hypothetical protein